MIQAAVDNSTLFGIPPAAFPGIVQELTFLNYNIVASSALLFWDILLTLNREVQYIWKSKFSSITLLFAAIRVLAVGEEIVNLAFSVGVLAGVTETICRNVVWFNGILGLVMSTGVDILLIFRVYALYGRNKVLLKFLCALEFMAFVAILCLLSLALPTFKLVPNPFPHQLRISSCILLGYSSIQPNVWIPILPVQTVLFSLAIGRCIYLQWRGPTFFSTIYYTFIRDGTWTFFALFVIFLLCIIGSKLHLIKLGTIAVYWCYPVIGICASRLILNLRSASDESHSLDVSGTNTKMVFTGGVVGSYESNTNHNSIQDSHEDA